MVQGCKRTDSMVTTNWIKEDALVGTLESKSIVLYSIILSS